MDKETFKEYFFKQEYDQRYQDVEYIDFIGYSEAYKTWDKIKDLVDWKDKRVADLGCFQGYFCFKIARLGGKVTGMEKNVNAIHTMDILNEVYGNIIETKQWVAGEEVSEKFEIALCLSALHHFGDQEKALQNIKSKIVIFEVNPNQVPLISKYFTIIKKVESHKAPAGVHRFILLTERKQ